MTEQEHILVCLAEECGEVQKHAHKALRFGVDDKDPTIENADTERRLIYYELQDLYAVIELLGDLGVIAASVNRTMIDAKKAKIRRYMNYARHRGVLAP